MLAFSKKVVLGSDNHKFFDLFVDSKINRRLLTELYLKDLEEYKEKRRFLLQLVSHKDSDDFKKINEKIYDEGSDDVMTSIRKANNNSIYDEDDMYDEGSDNVMISIWNSISENIIEPIQIQIFGKDFKSNYLSHLETNSKKIKKEAKMKYPYAPLLEWSLYTGRFSVARKLFFKKSTTIGGGISSAIVAYIILVKMGDLVNRRVIGAATSGENDGNRNNGIWLSKLEREIPTEIGFYIEQAKAIIESGWKRNPEGMLKILRRTNEEWGGLSCFDLVTVCYLINCISYRYHLF